MSLRIAVVIVNWNKKNDVVNLLNELSVITYPTFDTFVVDNASTDDSVKEIKSKFPYVTLILNKQNLGGTGGFNSGMKFVCNKNKYEYIWLLDNDAKIKTNTLAELEKAMDGDSTIGIAGSTIIDIEEKSIIVETGSNFRWDMMGVIPKNRNVKMHKLIKKDVDVDYVAICSALVRVTALKKVGLMDDRLFLFWDDMDWGLYFKKNKFRVICVATSLAYHGSFSEKERGNITNCYYGIRNPLLVYSKHTQFLKRLTIFYRSIRFYMKGYFFF